MKFLKILILASALLLTTSVVFSQPPTYAEISITAELNISQDNIGQATDGNFYELSHEYTITVDSVNYYVSDSYVLLNEAGGFDFSAQPGGIEPLPSGWIRNSDPSRVPFSAGPSAGQAMALVLDANFNGYIKITTLMIEIP